MIRVIFFSFLLSSIIVSDAQIIESVRPQPLDLSLKFISKCCELLDASANDLLRCALNATLHSNYQVISSSAPKLKIGLVTYSTQSIKDYAAYSLSIISAYAEQNGYIAQHLSPESGDEYESNDQRWNKVAIVRAAIDPSTGWARGLDYVVYLDSDLVILDFGFKIELVAQEFSDSDFIVSKDSQPMNGLMNSGFFMVKNSPWSRSFMARYLLRNLHQGI